MTEPSRQGNPQPPEPQSPAPEPEAQAPEPDDASRPTDPSRPPRASQGESPLYKGEPLEAERGPGLGCFWLQVILLGTLLVLTPLTVLWAWDERISAVLLVVTLLLLLFAGQTVIFLLRLVAADRRTRRVPRSPTARRTVGMIEEAGTQGVPGSESAAPQQEEQAEQRAVPSDSTDARPGGTPSPG